MPISFQVVPPGGWKYLQAQNDGTQIPITGESYFKMVDNIIAHRKSNGLVAGDPISESVRQIEERFPYLSTIKQ